MSAARRRGLVLTLAALLLVAVVAVIVVWRTSGPADQQASGITTSPPAPTTSEAGQTFPGTEALSPPPKDPTLADFAAELATLPAGSATGTVVLTITGLVGFDEPVTGSCQQKPDQTVIDVQYADKSRVLIEVGASAAAALTLTAPSAPTVTANLADVQAKATDGALTLKATLLRAGTSENTGSITADLVCAVTA